MSKRILSRWILGLCALVFGASLVVEHAEAARVDCQHVDSRLALDDEDGCPVCGGSEDGASFRELALPSDDVAAHCRPSPLSAASGSQYERIVGVPPMR